jgi:hypothetical protein
MPIAKPMVLPKAGTIEAAVNLSTETFAESPVKVD